MDTVSPIGHPKGPFEFKSGMTAFDSAYLRNYEAMQSDMKNHRDEETME